MLLAGGAQGRVEFKLVRLKRFGHAVEGQADFVDFVSAVRVYADASTHIALAQRVGGLQNRLGRADDEPVAHAPGAGNAQRHHGEHGQYVQVHGAVALGRHQGTRHADGHHQARRAAARNWRKGINLLGPLRIQPVLHALLAYLHGLPHGADRMGAALQAGHRRVGGQHRSMAIKQHHRRARQQGQVVLKFGQRRQLEHGKGHAAQLAQRVINGHAKANAGHRIAIAADGKHASLQRRLEKIGLREVRRTRRCSAGAQRFAIKSEHTQLAELRMLHL